MAYVKYIWFKDLDNDKSKMTVVVKLHPEGDVHIDVDIPQDFKDCILVMAQAAADLHEQQMKANILAAGKKEENIATEEK